MALATFIMDGCSLVTKHIKLVPAKDGVVLAAQFIKASILVTKQRTSVTKVSWHTHNQGFN